MKSYIYKYVYLDRRILHSFKGIIIKYILICIRKSQDQEQSDLQCQLLREAIKTEKLRQEAEKCRAEAERSRAEREKLKKFMMLQECRDKGYVLPDDF